MSSKLNLNNRIYNAYQSNGTINNLFDQLEASIDQNIDNKSKLSDIVKNIPGGSVVNILTKDSSLVPRSQYDLYICRMTNN